MAMPAYIGGSIVRLASVGMARISKQREGSAAVYALVVLNDTETGAPIAVMPGNLIPAPIVRARSSGGTLHLARTDADSVAVIGPGLINQVAFRAIPSTRPAIARDPDRGAFAHEPERAALPGTRPLEFPQIRGGDRRFDPVGGHRGRHRHGRRDRSVRRRKLPGHRPGVAARRVRMSRRPRTSKSMPGSCALALVTSSTTLRSTKPSSELQPSVSRATRSSRSRPQDLYSWTGA